MHTLPPTVVKNITEADVEYYQKYTAQLVEKEVMQEMFDEQYALIENDIKNRRKYP